MHERVSPVGKALPQLTAAIEIRRGGTDSLLSSHNCVDIGFFVPSMKTGP